MSKKKITGVFCCRFSATEDYVHSAYGDFCVVVVFFSVCSEGKNEDLLHEVILIVGYFTVLNNDNQVNTGVTFDREILEENSPISFCKILNIKKERFACFILSQWPAYFRISSADQKVRTTCTTRTTVLQKSAAQ